ncbi:nucleotide exchange factor GrpE [Parvularcula dongshanensis]|uniref:Protein GrpE n=1 Tax=Parvularcula dongshanensis TaxID=1173995 RepID=A0A840HZ66_9PROT|nr:nucleotide exchange factor GrpE [Parvularcula dongshanensis]MBB4658136.1 molecular chaperone GrpE [Parvularcula dongshanensis]
MSETNAAPQDDAPKNDAPETSAEETAEVQATPEFEPIPEHLRDEALDGHQIKKLAEERIAEMQAELEAANDKALRLAAELENTRRRAERERGEAARYGISGFARDLLSVADNMAKAIELAPEDPSSMTKEGLEALVNGMRMTERELIAVFERNGVTRIAPKGERFDPNLHQAIAQVPGGGLPKDHVADVAAPGFVIGDRVLRAAMVTVSTGAEAQPQEG